MDEFEDIKIDLEIMAAEREKKRLVSIEVDENVIH